MKHLILFTLIAILVCFQVQAQAQVGLIPTPGYTLSTQGYSDEYDIVIHATVQNNTGGNINLKWKRIDNNIPSGWENLICDNETCWPSAVSTNYVPLTNGQSSIMDCHFRPHDIIGAGTVRVRIWATNDSIGTAITMEFACNALISGISDPFPKGTLRVYPNPAKEFTNIAFSTYDQVGYIEIFNIIGTKVGSYTISAGVESFYVDTETYIEGIYFVSLYDKQHKRIATKTFSKTQ